MNRYNNLDGKMCQIPNIKRASARCFDSLSLHSFNFLMHSLYLLYQNGQSQSVQINDKKVKISLLRRKLKPDTFSFNSRNKLGLIGHPL